jgi:hypothetical protein
MPIYIQCVQHSAPIFSSKALLFMYLKSDVVNAIFGDDGGEKILHFIRGCIIPHEQSYCFYLRKHVRHFENTANSGHEGTNHATKCGPSRVLPQYTVDKSAKVQVDMDHHKFDLYHRRVANALLGHATWSSSSTVNELTLPAEFMLTSALEECERYASWRTAEDKWLVIRSVERSVHSLYPRFHRLYTITLQSAGEGAGCLMCSCKYFECNGMVCQHLVHVKRYYSSTSDITHHDISVRWWKAYLYFSMKSTRNPTPTEMDVRRELQNLRNNECKGPSFEEKMQLHSVSQFCQVYQFGKDSSDEFRFATERTLPMLFQKKSAIHQVVNYTMEEVMSALQQTSSNTPFSMSQELYIVHDNDDVGFECSDDHGEGGDYDDDDCLGVELPAARARIDFGSRYHLADDFSGSCTYNVHNMILPRVKELVGLIAAADNSRERGMVVERILDDLIRKEKENLATKKSAPQGQLVSACPVGKAKRTKVSQWSH